MKRITKKRLIALLVVSVFGTMASGCNIAGMIKTEVKERECEHTWIDGNVIKSATCSEIGVRMQFCPLCEKVGTEEIPLLAHTELVVKGYSETCTETGLTDGVVCSVCNVTLVERTVIPVLGHDEYFLPYSEATCTADGNTEGCFCQRCEEVLTMPELLPAFGHSYDSGKITREPTCSARGEKVYTCATCSGTITEALEQIDHIDLDGNFLCDDCGFENLVSIGQSQKLSFGRYRVYRAESRLSFHLALLGYLDELGDFCVLVCSPCVPALGDNATVSISWCLGAVQQNFFEFYVYDEYVEFVFQDGTGTYTLDSGVEYEVVVSDSPNWDVIDDPVTVYKVLNVNE